MAEVQLKRSLTLGLLTFYGLGNILGAGIYVLVGKVAAEAGIWAPLSFLLAACVAGITAFSYAELSARYPSGAGEAAFIWEGFHLRWLSVTAGVLIVLAGTVSSATLIHGFCGYLQEFVPVPDLIAQVALIIILTSLACWGITESVTVAAVLTVIEMVGLLLIVSVGLSTDVASLDNIRQAAGESLKAPDGISHWELIPLAGIISGAFLAFYAYIGFEDMVTVAEEVKNPERNMPRAIFIALIVSTLLYAIVVYVALTVLPIHQLAESKAPLAAIYRQSTGQEPYIISLIGLSAVLNGALIQLIMGSRILFGMAKKGWLLKPLANINVRTRTPVFATLTVGGLVLLLTLSFSLVKLAELTSLLILVVFTLANAALILIKRRVPTVANVRVFPIWIPILGFSATLVLLISKLIVSI